ncbi:hypothetical protein ACYOEI_18005 [Singulisphaera rosea]
MNHAVDCEDALLEGHSDALARAWDEQREARVAYPVAFLITGDALTGYLETFARVLLGARTPLSADETYCGATGLELMHRALLDHAVIDWVFIRKELITALSQNDGPTVVMVLGDRIRIASALTHAFCC